jgi:hypothetical protein
MSYHRFPNLRELFQQDLSAKINRDLEDEDFKTLPCNCQSRKTKGCDYGGVCRESIVVYKVECKNTGKIYIGNTQQKLKTRMQQHYQEVRQLHIRGKKSDSLADHFATQLQNFEEITPNLFRNSIKMSIIWKGNAISAVKTFSTPTCVLCNRERLEILRAFKHKPEKLINSCNEIYGACRHNNKFLKFHRYCKQTSTGTDEPNKGERIQVQV